MPAEDQILISILIQEAQTQIAKEIEFKTLSPDDLVTLNKVLDWIDQAAVFYLNGQTDEEILGSYSPAVASNDRVGVFEFITGARDWETLVAWWQSPATIDEVERALDAQEATGGVTPEYQAWADKHGYETQRRDLASESVFM